MTTSTCKLSAWMYVALWLALLSACGTVATPPSATSSTTHASAHSAASSTTSLVDAASSETRYRIDDVHSWVHVLVYRGGPMAQLGHNHVMSVNKLQGEAWQRANQGGLELQFQLADLVVDDAQARVAEGDDFSSVVNEAARAGTRRNMLRAEVLDAERYPDVMLRATGVSLAEGQVIAQVDITLHGQTQRVPVSFAWTRDHDAWRAQGEFRLTQTAFGITPYQVAMGALRVEDEMRVCFDLLLRDSR